jgi:hypothetical protein
MNNEQKKNNVIETLAMKEALVMAETLLNQDAERVGKIAGSPGTGKTVASKYLAEKFQDKGAVRLCGFGGITRRELLISLARAWGHPSPRNGTYGALLDWCAGRADGRLILIDEADELNHNVVEPLRTLADEHGAAVVLFGSEIMERQFADPRSGAYLARLARRVGTSVVRFKPIAGNGEAEIAMAASYFINPDFGDVSKSAAKEFLNVCKGFWGEARELARACKRVLAQSEGEKKLTVDVIRAAARDMTQGR